MIWFDFCNKDLSELRVDSATRNLIACLRFNVGPLLVLHASNCYYKGLMCSLACLNVSFSLLFWSARLWNEALPSMVVLCSLTH